jgi:acyl dehydratase
MTQSTATTDTAPGAAALGDGDARGDPDSAAMRELAEAGSFTTRARTVTEADVAAFAALTGDWHPQHSDAEWSKESMFGERVAHGMLVISIGVGLAPIDYDRLVALRRVDATFNRPVKLGDTIHVVGRVHHVKPLDDDFALVTWAWKIVNQDTKVVARAHMHCVWRNDPSKPLPTPPGKES